MLIKTVLLILTVILQSCNLLGKFNESPKAVDGVLNLVFWDFEKKGAINLEGYWGFVNREFIEPNPNKFKSIDKPFFLKVPGVWDKFKDRKYSYNAYGFGSYYLRLILPSKKTSKRFGFRIKEQATAYDFFIDGELITNRGKVSDKPDSAIPQYGTRTIYYETEKEELFLVFHISNYHHRSGGLWNSPIFGLQEQITFLQYERNFIEFALGGSILIITIYHFMLYFFRRNDKASKFFALFCLVTLMRVISTGEVLLIQLFPNIPLEIIAKLEYISFFLLGPLFFQFNKELFTEDIPEYLNKIFLGIAYSLSFIALFSNIKIYNHFVDVYYIFLFFLTIISYYYYIKILILRRKDGLVFFLFTNIFIFFSLNDILTVQRIIHTTELLQLGVFIFLVGQSIIISRRLSIAFSEIEILSEKLNTLNKKYSKFVPEEFLKFFEKKSILEVEIGDYAEKEITVLYSGIRDFISLTEELGSKEIIIFLNKYYYGLTKIISENNGFIDKFVGDDITVIFPNSPEDAVIASKEILLYLNNFNRNKFNPKIPEIKIGIGIHTGKSHFGTIGGVNRLDTTLIGDTVMIARKIENLTKTFHIPILLSFQTYSYLDTSLKRTIREIESTKIRGRDGFLTLFEFFGYEKKETIEKKISLTEDFFSGITKFRAGLIKPAREVFLKCNTIIPDDPIFILYLNRCNEAIILKNNTDKNKTNVLIADANEFILEFLELILIKEHVDVIIARNSSEFKSLTKQITPELIILSNHFDDEMVEDLVSFIRENLKLDSDKCKIAISTSNLEIDEEKYFKLGVNDILFKPFNFNSIHSLIQKIK